MKREEEEKGVPDTPPTSDATFIIERSYPNPIHVRLVQLTIESMVKLPDEFFAELGKLVGKYADNQ